MTQSPPVPPRNQSPYPLQEPPHSSVREPEASEMAQADEMSSQGPSTKVLAAVGGLLGFGAALLLALRLTANRKTAVARRP